MVEVGGKPILWHIMNIYAFHGVNEFIIALGCKSEIIKEYFLNFYAINNDITVDLCPVVKLPFMMAINLIGKSTL